jgi:hypothetical protein
MVRLQYVFILPVLALGACVTPSKSLGAGESTDGDDTTASDPTPGTGEETTGDPVCPPNPRFTCTAPYEGTFGPCGGEAFDENCCLPLVCDDDDDCADGETCQSWGFNGLGCADVEIDGELVCQCAADPGGITDKVCTPGGPQAEEWCAVFTDEASCNDAPPMEIPDAMSQFCSWTDVQTLTIDGDMCAVEASPKCLTYQFTGEDGCISQTCAVGSLLLADAIARPIGDDAFEVTGTPCGTARVLGDWISADDPSLGQCAMTCVTCDIILVDYVEMRSESSKDAPVDDCGALTLEDPLADWQAAQACALQHATAGEGFRLVADLQGIDSFVQVGFMGIQGESYATSRFGFEEGGLVSANLTEVPGAGLEAVAACEVAVGELCLAVTSPGELVQLCPA